VARDRIMDGLRGRGNIDGVDLLDVEQLAPFGRGLARIGRGGDLGKPLRLDLGNIEAVDERVRRAGVGTDAPAPAGADDADVYSAHDLPLFCGVLAVAGSLLNARTAGKRRGPAARDWKVFDAAFRAFCTN